MSHGRHAAGRRDGRDFCCFMPSVVKASEVAMLHSVKKLKGMKILAADGDAGKIKDIYFDDEAWTIRHFEADTGGWLTGRKILLSPISVTGIDWKGKAIRVALTRRQIQDAPGLEAHKPISRQHEEALYGYYGYPYYWTGPYLWGYSLFPGLFDSRPLEDPERQDLREEMEEEGNDAHLRNCNEVFGYDIHTTDDTVGHIDDFLFDEENWSIRLLVVDTRNWWPGKHVLISPQRVRQVSWEEKEAFVDASRQEIENSEEYDENHPPSMEGRAELYRAPDHPSARL
jgi:uncharacterized protein YrrD